MLMQNLLGLIQTHARLDGHQLVFGHNFRDRSIKLLFEAQIPIRQNSNQSPMLGYRKSRDAVFLMICASEIFCSGATVTITRSFRSQIF